MSRYNKQTIHRANILKRTVARLPKQGDRKPRNGLKHGVFCNRLRRRGKPINTINGFFYGTDNRNRRSSKHIQSP